MDFFDFDNVKAQKAGAILWYSHLRSLTNLFRVIEFGLALLLLSWIFNRLPFLVTVFLRVAGVIASPIFVFMLCNAIIVTLIVKSGRFSGENPAADNAETELYEELLKNNGNHPCPKSLSSSSSEIPSPSPQSPPPATEEIEYQDKEIIISKINAVAKTASEGDDCFGEMGLSSDSESDSNNPRVYRRSKSMKLESSYPEKVTGKKLLRRSETEKCRNEVISEGLCLEDELSDEEFQRAVDEFIAKHLRLRRQESMSIVLQKRSSISEIEKNGKNL
ncbi:uncharacterized protein LOC8273366 [Ricinus communis]|uniref:uncharacterized protein LOC8273366 n=1 Tax=Ricinus communis TaxID=3988 RepID=UPI00201B2693|nr:uncharacterized protein LOC8273366 [Ricinus communis]